MHTNTRYTILGIQFFCTLHNSFQLLEVVHALTGDSRNVKRIFHRFFTIHEFWIMGEIEVRQLNFTLTICLWNAEAKFEWKIQIYLKLCVCPAEERTPLLDARV